MERKTYNQGQQGYDRKPFGQNRQGNNSRGGYNQGGFQKFGDRQDREGGFQKPRFGGNRQERGGYGGGNGGFQNKENYYNQDRGQDSRGGQGFRGGFNKGPRQDANASMMSGGSHFSKKPSNSLVAISVNPEEAKA